MKQYLGPHDLANELRMRRTRWSGAFLVVEGDTDARFYGRFVRHQCLANARGKEQVIECLRLLLAGGFEGAVAIVDRDLWALGEGSMPELEGLMCTDERDLEIMALRSPALDRVLAELGSSDKIERLRRAGRSVIDILLDAGSQIGYLRWLNERDRCREDWDEGNALALDGRLRLKFHGLDFGKLVDRDTLAVDGKTLLEAISSHSRQWPHAERVTEALDALREVAVERGIDRWDLCSGHDLVELLGIGLRKCFGSREQKELSFLSSFVLLAYGDDRFRQTALFASMQAWSAAHPDRALLL